ncbi:MAG: aspartate carbamoyltransferase [Candidatus Gracilibacteria bacterium]|nr:aspartate carbamoyltransferase [Candidatus Gracilibacteria bacterium]
MKKLPFKDILHTNQFSKKDLKLIFETALDMEKYITGEKTDEPLKGKIMASMFYEPSTRTRLSHESAMLRLGGKVITVSDSTATSLSKGEILEDNAKMIAIYSDIIVMRHPEAYSVQTTAEAISKPVINAGDGPHQHPTQALLDVYTILKERKTLDNLKIALVGDLKYGRTTHSLVFLMGLFKNIEFTFINPEGLGMPEKVTTFLKDKNIKYSETINYKNGIKNCDVLYVTRIQKERFPDLSEYEELKNDFILDLKILDGNTDITILHPLPRVNEVSTEVELTSKCNIF